MQTRFGFIGGEEIELAKEKLVSKYYNDDDWYDITLWFEKPHRGNSVRAYEYECIDELLDEIESPLTTFIKDEKPVYMIGDEISDDKESLIINEIRDGQYYWHGSPKQAFEQLSDWKGWKNDCCHTELLAVGILNS